MDLMEKEFWKNEFVTDAGRQFMSNILELVTSEPAFIGDIYSYSAKVLVIPAYAKDELSIELECSEEDFKVQENELFFIEVCLEDSDDEEFAIQISNSECYPVGFVSLS